MSAAQLTAKANKAYALAQYEEAADHYAEASQLLADENGEDSIKNADILYLYGRALFKVALQKSQVLGGGGEEAEPAKPDKATNTTNGKSHNAFEFNDEGGEGSEEEEEGAKEQNEDAPVETTTEDDFQSAWEILDLARSHFQKQTESDEFEKKEEISKRLAETLDLLGEIALENESFDQAVSDFRSALQMKQKLYPPASSQISGAHYMLALALEYSTSPESRQDAIIELQAAIKCFEERLSKVENETERSDEQSMLVELRAKLAELSAPPVSHTAKIAELFASEGTALKESIVNAMATSNDLTGLVRKKQKRVEPDSGNGESSKRAKTDAENGGST